MRTVQMGFFVAFVLPGAFFFVMTIVVMVRKLVITIASELVNIINTTTITSELITTILDRDGLIIVTVVIS